MRITETKEITKKITITTDIICNKCGESCKSYVFEDGGAQYSGLIELEYQGGYFSDKIGDGVSHKFSLCENCLAILFSGFKIPSRVGG